PILMGIGIGASVPVMLSALGASVNGKRTAFVYLIIDVLGAVIVGVIFYAVNAAIHFPFMIMTMTMFSIALTNTLYRLAVVIVLAPLVGVLEKIVCLMFPESDDALAEKADMDLLEERFLEHPALSISQSKMVIDSMATKALEAVLGAIKVRREYDPNGIKKVRDLEDVLDRYEDKIGSYLFKITTSDLNEKQSQEIAEYLNVITDFERIGDHTRNVTEAVEEIEEKKINLSGDALKEMSILEDAITEVITLTIDAFVSNDTDTALKIEPLEEVIDVICDQIKSNHIDRVSRQECTLENGFAFDDLLTDYERISDHCSNIAINVMKAKNVSLDPREYYNSIDNIKQIAFENYLQEYRKKYEI
ncbi:MAG: Na/Pi cotransporter family protein, partial [Erysipelotrichaceae bacterium]|nr:Na/Pi cotransporter family protein [Erysipelotrichaceae bacterium]